MSTTNRKGRSILVRPSGFDDDYQAARKAELLEPENPVTAEEIRNGDLAVAASLRRRGPMTSVTRRPHASYLLGEQNSIIMAELERLKKKLAGSTDGLREEDIRRLKDLNEMVARNLREEREQVKLEHFEDMTDEELRKALEEEYKRAQEESE